MTATPNELVRRLLPCPFCGNRLSMRSGVNGYGRCETEDCWVKSRALIVPLDDATQVGEWNRRATALEATASPVVTDAYWSGAFRPIIRPTLTLRKMSIVLTGSGAGMRSAKNRRSGRSVCFGWPTTPSYGQVSIPFQKPKPPHRPTTNAASSPLSHPRQSRSLLREGRQNDRCSLCRDRWRVLRPAQY